MHEYSNDHLLFNLVLRKMSPASVLSSVLFRSVLFRSVLFPFLLCDMKVLRLDQVLCQGSCHCKKWNWKTATAPLSYLPANPNKLDDVPMNRASAQLQPHVAPLVVVPERRHHT